MLLEELRNISATKKDLRNFGVVMAVALALVASFLLWKRNDLCWIFFGCGAGLALIGFIAPVLLWPFHRVWMILAGVLGWIMGRIILTVLYYLVLTPMALVGRLFGKSFLDTRMKGKDTDSYWSYRKKQSAGPERYEEQF